MASAARTARYGSSSRVVSVPHPHDSVPDVLVHPAAKVRDHHIEPLPDPIHELDQKLRIQRLRQGGEITHVGKQHGDLPTPLLRGLRKLPPQSHDGCFHDLVGNHTTQFLLRSDRQLELSPVNYRTSPSRRTARPHPATADQARSADGPEN